MKILNNLESGLITYNDVPYAKTLIYQKYKRIPHINADL